MERDDSKPDGAPAAPLFDKNEGLLTGTPAFEALFDELEHTIPADTISLGLLLGSNFASFG